MADNVDLNFLATQFERVLTGQREIRDEQREIREELTGIRQEMSVMRSDMADMRRAILQLIDKAMRHERRFDELERRIVEAKDDIELMMRSEVMGRLAYFETKMEARFREGFSEGEQPRLTP